MPATEPMWECSNKFQYYPLQASSGWIRLLRRQKGKESEPLECDIMTANLFEDEDGLSKPPKYYAVVRQGQTW
jgi:hypothetical protein